MISKASLSLLQYLILVLTADVMMSETYPHDTTDIPDDQKELKELDSSRRELENFPPHSPYVNSIFNFQKASEGLLGFPYYHLSGSPWELDSSRPGDGFPEETSAPKRDGRQFKQGGQRFRFDPALKMLGLGKRDGGDRPKYNPGWKFIGLGKRVSSFQQDSDPSMDSVKRNDFKAGASDVLLPYFHFLAMQDVGKFLDGMEGRLQGNQRRNNKSQSSSPSQMHSDLYSPLGGRDLSQKDGQSSAFFAAGSQNGDPGKSLKPQLFFTRSRKPNRMWKNNSRPMYDPGYMMTGLGK